MLAVLMFVAGITVVPIGSPGEAKGTISYAGKSGKTVVTVMHAYMVKGPDAVTGQPMRRVVLSTKDVSAALKACASMMCSDGGIEEGMTIDFDVPPRLNYWFVANGQRIQYSGTADPKSVKLATDTAQRLAGTWDLDASTAGGPVIKVEFDAALIREIKGK
jgi:hypothetical protein